ncbi:MAG: hypothetical protein JXR50_02420 [Prolixibacteraceae bacterium]|nr:hypothetical protein [Prolixibacteraceae bacterium]MBN2648574.1 hypothetical protein [Prolixibacteraceae bacterium]
MHFEPLNIVLFLLLLAGCQTETNTIEQRAKAQQHKTEKLLTECEPFLFRYFQAADDRAMASAVIYPELLRYSILRDKIEIGALKTLYIQYGSNYANFSIGPFQMKPTFAEKIEKECLKYQLPFFTANDTLHTTHTRALRVKKLSESEGQVQYLLAFLVVTRLLFVNYPFSSIEEEVRLYATAYHTGCLNDIEKIKQIQHQKYYHTDLWPDKNTVYHNYARIALYGYKHSTFQ